MEYDFSNARKVTTREKYYATAKVGRDVIENAEYITFEHSDWLKKEEVYGFKKLWCVIEDAYWKAKRWARETYWEVYYGFERMFKGYDCVETFSTFHKFIERYGKILTELRNNHAGYPYDLTEEEWDRVLDDMIYHLYYMDEHHVIEELEKDVPDNWSASAKTTGEIMNKHKDEFFKLFSEYFYNLWD